MTQIEQKKIETVDDVLRAPHHLKQLSDVGVT
jgi:hypothetical protein